MNDQSRIAIGRDRIARSFKSGNSVALRLPKELGFKAGDEVIITDNEDGSFSIRPVDDRAASLDALYGAFSDDFMADGRGDTDQHERDWNMPDAPAGTA